MGNTQRAEDWILEMRGPEGLCLRLVIESEEAAETVKRALWHAHQAATAPPEPAQLLPSRTPYPPDWRPPRRYSLCGRLLVLSQGASISAEDADQLILAEGYRTKSRNFSMRVRVVLNNDQLFVRLTHDTYTARFHLPVNVGDWP